ncbi:MAG TPA: ABC transporter ATP-binding protein, partial [Gemmatimonadales bacterium]|nr:ABC transporter ATP-binding protein [Gemmatimonadales bacterium]
MPIVECIRVSKTFRSVKAVDAISCQVRRGEFFSLLGPSGCGKTTTLRLLAGLEEPDQGGGDIRIAGRSVLGTPPYQRRLGMVFQGYALFPHLTVERNLAYGLQRRRVPDSEIPGRVVRALELVRLGPA